MRASPLARLAPREVVRIPDQSRPRVVRAPAICPDCAPRIGASAVAVGGVAGCGMVHVGHPASTISLHGRSAFVGKLVFSSVLSCNQSHWSLSLDRPCARTAQWPCCFCQTRASGTTSCQRCMRSAHASRAPVRWTTLARATCTRQLADRCQSVPNDPFQCASSSASKTYHQTQNNKQL